MLHAEVASKLVAWVSFTKVPAAQREAFPSAAVRPTSANWNARACRNAPRAWTVPCDADVGAVLCLFGKAIWPRCSPVPI